ncbi:hypothetical protein AX16_002571 [Volvariella volvacea WC 439]|nr:hypothetical protein AX16_002571 [Volvariella volvacea WC 439]
MRLPRRVPWASVAEIDQLCAWIYTDEHDIPSKILAINRLSAWRAITALPHAMESTLAMLSVVVEDKLDTKHKNYLPLRQSYASALTRLVNGLVDQLQLGAYARSIASIAHQLGLPQWLVELRHAATHEDLPSLELLREAARQSMGWLLHNYFLPTINPSSSSNPRPPPLRPLIPVLKQYKNILKLTTRDASLKSQYRQDIAAIFKDIERWISEAKVVANVSAAEYGWTSGAGSVDATDIGEQDAKERWALDKLCDVLLERGTLVPLSKKKRVFPVDSFLPPELSVSLWTPLLVQLVEFHPDLPSILVNRICTHLVAMPSPASTVTDINESKISQPDPSYDMCLARWAMWCIETWQDLDLADEGDAPSKEDKQNQGGLRKSTILTLFRGLGPAYGEQTDKKAAKFLLQALCTGNSDIEPALDFLIKPSKAPNASLSSQSTWTSDDMDTMSQRLQTLLSSLDAAAASSPTTTPSASVPASTSQTPLPIPAQDPRGPATQTASTTAAKSNNYSDNGGDDDEDIALPPGWKLLDTKNSFWRPCPIGVHVPSTPQSIHI